MADRLKKTHPMSLKEQQCKLAREILALKNDYKHLDEDDLPDDVAAELSDMLSQLAGVGQQLDAARISNR